MKCQFNLSSFSNVKTALAACSWVSDARNRLAVSDIVTEAGRFAEVMGELSSDMATREEKRDFETRTLEAYHIANGLAHGWIGAFS